MKRSVPRSIAVFAPWFLLAVFLAACSPSAGTPARPAATSAAPSCPWLDQALPAHKRVALLLARMTLDDKITMVGGQGTNEPYVFYMAAQPALCIPAMGMEDGPDGVGDRLAGVTQLPAAVSLAATFDPALARRYGTVIGAEERGKGASVNLGPTVNIDRDPRWGRSFEAFTEDPFLNAALAASEIEGVQSQGVMSQVKHFAAYNQETNRNTPADDVIVSDRALHEIYLPAFQRAVTRARAASVMCAYSTVNGAYSCQNPYLLTQTLDQRWHFKGFVTSDDGAIHSTSAALDGTDMEQPFKRYFGQPLEQDVRHGTMPVSVLNGMVSRILTEMFRFSLFNRPPTGSATATVTTPAHQAVATKVAEDGTVLLKNSGGTLPLPAAKAGPIAVIGPAASAAPTDAGGGSSFVTPAVNVTPLQGLTAAAGPGTRIVYQQGLPVDSRLPAIPAPALSPAYAATRPGGSYSGTLTAPETGTYVLAVDNPCRCYKPTSLYLNGTQILSDPGTRPVSTYSAGVRLQAGQAYSIKITGESSSLSWATPSALAPGISQAVAAARSASAAVVVVSDDTETEATDRPGLRLPSAQNELISAVAAASPHTVVVIDAGAPVAMPWIRQVAAVVDAWYPGESNGTALASVLYGATDPSGHLPVTFPRKLSQVPASTPAEFPGVNGKVEYSEGISVGYRWYDARGIRPLFPFGYGLSYTTFRFSKLHVTPADVRNRHFGPGRASCHCNGHSIPLVRVSARVTNTGHARGSDVAQLYLGDPASAGEPPRQLKGFRKVTLRPGRFTTVRFSLDGRDLSYWSDAANGWVVPDGRFSVRVGDSSALASLPLKRGFTVTRGSTPARIKAGGLPGS
jgi:beta-glucosidase